LALKSESEVLAFPPSLIFKPRATLPKRVHKINTTFFETFYDFGFLPSLLAKPTKYSVERERRIIFEIRDDLKAPTITARTRRC
jgi:hypothetical protein